MHDDRAAAEVLFDNGWNQKQIAEIIGRSEKTISLWAKEGEWREARQKEQLFDGTSKERVQKLIDYQLRVLERISDIQETLLEGNFDLADVQKLLLQNGHMDGLSKMFNAIKDKELAWEDYIIIIRELTEFLNQKGFQHLNLAQPFFNDFLQEKRLD